MLQGIFSASQREFALFYHESKKLLLVVVPNLSGAICIARHYKDIIDQQ
jgi:hypothetical protein